MGRRHAHNMINKVAENQAKLFELLLDGSDDLQNKFKELITDFEGRKKEKKV